MRPKSPRRKPQPASKAAFSGVGNVDHDRLFKELLRVCFADFIELFLPEVFAYLDPASISFIDKETHSPLLGRAKRTGDLLVKARFKGRMTYFLIHVEVQSQRRNWSSRRMFDYFAAETHLHKLPLYPIALLAWDEPRTPDPGKYVIQFPDRRVLEFNYAVIQLNRLNWREYLQRDNPAACALMAKMGVAPHDFTKVRSACVRMIGRLPMKRDKFQVIMEFIDAYLPLTPAQEQEFEQDKAQWPKAEREVVMEYITSWERKGRELGKLEGKVEGKLESKVEDTLKLLGWRLGQLSQATQKRIGELPLEQLDELFDAAFRFEKKAELSDWLRQPNGGKARRNTPKNGVTSLSNGAKGRKK